MIYLLAMFMIILTLGTFPTYASIPVQIGDFKTQIPSTWEEFNLGVEQIKQKLGVIEQLPNSQNIIQSGNQLIQNATNSPVWDIFIWTLIIIVVLFLVIGGILLYIALKFFRKMKYNKHRGYR